MHKAQVSIEYMALLVIFIIALMIAAFFSLQYTIRINDASLRNDISDFIDDTGRKINIVYMEGEGFSMNATIPESLGGRNYSVHVQSNLLIVSVDGTDYVKHLAVDNITGSLDSGIQTIKNRGEFLEIT